MLNRKARMIHSHVLVARRQRMEAILHFVQVVGKAEEGHVGTLDHGDKFTSCRIAALLVVGGDRDEGSQTFDRVEALES